MAVEHMHGIVRELLDCSPQAVKQQNSPQPCSPEGLQCPLLTPREGLLFASALWRCLWVMSASSYEKQQVQKQSTHGCARRDWWDSRGLSGPGPPGGTQTPLICQWSLPPPRPLPPRREFYCKKMKSACTASHPVPFRGEKFLHG